MAQQITFPIALGDEVRDLVTGFTGIVISLTVWFNKCQRATVQPPVDKDGKPQMAEVFDVEQLEVITVLKVPQKTERTDAAGTRRGANSGGPMPDVRQHATPSER